MTPQTERRDILYFGNDWFAENRTSSHHIARCLARDHRVFYLECPGLRAPKGSTRDVRKIFTKLWRFARGASLVEADSEAGQGSLYVRTLFQIPLHRFALIRLLNQWLLWLTIKWLMVRTGIRRPIAWHVIPHLANIAGKVGEERVVYYCIDDYAALPDVDVKSIRTMDESLSRRADIVFVASETLLADKRRMNANTYLSPHGVDVAHFAKAQELDAACPADIADLPRPIIGFFGLIERWIDLDLVSTLAQRRPEWSFAMLGRVAVPASDVPHHSNLHFLGQRPYELLPSYGRAFDVSIIPYRPTTQVLHANPLKLREYLAMGKPVVSVSTPEIENFRDVVAIATSPSQFEEMIEAATRPGNINVNDVRRRQERVRDMSWESVVARAWSLVKDASSTNGR
jgi:glycosyltransferase involved in cell wall biosynthesis